MPRSEVSDNCTNLNEQTIEGILGIIWKIKDDILKVDLVRKTFPLTKRGILSQLCTIFDPLGILNPCTLELKLIVQELWLRKIEWDSIIPKDLLDRFNKFQNRFIYLENIEINRYYGFDSSTETTELHIFADSSNQAYGPVAYIRDVKKDRVNISFVLGKSRLAPLDKNALTIPKLKLSAAVVAVRIKVKLLEESNISMNKVYFWVDSKTVLRYIRYENKCFSVFVSHRVNEIRSNSNIADWHFIEGKLNLPTIVHA